jgi:ribosomal-protein-alanine N-acetyltransferase
MRDCGLRGRFYQATGDPAELFSRGATVDSESDGMDMIFRTRSANPTDYPAFARVFSELRIPDPIPSAAAFAERFLPRVVMLIDQGDAPVGYATWRFYGRTAHVVHVAVAPQVQRRGGGRALMHEVRARVTTAGCTRWYLNVKQDNASAIRLYERSGMAIEREGWAVDLEWLRAAKLPGNWEAGGQEAAGQPFAPIAEDDASIAACLGVDVERIAHLRAQSGVVLRALREGGAPVAFGAFDPAYPSIYPLQATGVGPARALLDAFRPQARHPRVHVVVEGNGSIAAALQEVGGELRHSTFRMAGVL